MDKIRLQVHDYDNLGIYRIILDCYASTQEVTNWKNKARLSLWIDWSKLPQQIRHVVFYAELLDKQNCVYLVGIYMHGQAYEEKDFERIFQRSDVGLVGAYHKNKYE